MQLSHPTQSPPRPELKFLVARIFTSLDLKEPDTFTPFNAPCASTATEDAAPETWPTWKKAHKMCKYLDKYGVFDFVDEAVKNTVDTSIQTIRFINDYKKGRVVPADHLITFKIASGNKFKKFINESLKLTSSWDVGDLKESIETYLIENETDATNANYYLSLAKTYGLSRMTKALTAQHKQ